MKSRTRLPSYRALACLAKDQSLKKPITKKNITLVLADSKADPYDVRNKENINYNNIAIVDRKKAASRSLISERQKVRSIVPKESALYPRSPPKTQMESQLPKKEAAQTDDEAKFPQGLSKYYHEIIYHLLKIENSNARIDQGFMERQKEVRVERRQDLVAELVELHERFRMKQTTLFKTVNVLDQYLNINKEVERKSFELVGIACLFLVAKYEEIYPPSMRHYVDAASKRFTSKELIAMEGEIINALSFNLCAHTTCQYIDTISVQFQFTEKEKLLCHYLAQLSLYNPLMSHSYSIEIALGCAINVKPEAEMEILSAFDKDSDVNVIECSTMIYKIWKKATDGSASNPTKRKYSHPNYAEVAKISSFNSL